VNAVGRLITTAELVQKLRLSRWTIARLVREGQIPCVQLSTRKRLFDEQAVDAALRQASTTGVQPAAELTPADTNVPVTAPA
jgi:excisionase family DNA binding protein